MALQFSLTDKELNRFLSRVAVSGPDDCWPWTGGCHKIGYGQFWVGKDCRYAHQVALVAAGRPRPDKPNHQALHGDTCTTRACCNPAHLRWGSIRENMDDRQRLGRTAHLKGSLNGHAKLTEDAVRDIRASSGPRAPLAERYGVSVTLISMVRCGHIWTHIT